MKLVILLITITLVVGCKPSTSGPTLATKAELNTISLRTVELDERLNAQLEILKAIDAQLLRIDSRITSIRNQQSRIVSLLARRNIEKMKKETS